MCSSLVKIGKKDKNIEKRLPLAESAAMKNAPALLFAVKYRQS